MDATKIYDDLYIGMFSESKEMAQNGFVCVCMTKSGDGNDCEVFPMNDGGGNSEQTIAAAIKRILMIWAEGKKAFVCCRHGQNRSVCISAAAITIAKREEWIGNALVTIGKKRTQLGPRDDTFCEVLRFVTKLKGLS